MGVEHFIGARRSILCQGSTGGTGLPIYRYHPFHCERSEIGGRVSDSRQLPVENRLDPGFLHSIDEIVDPVVTMDDRGARLFRNSAGQPFDQLFNLRDIVGLRGPILLRPEIDLPREKLTGSPEVPQAERLMNAPRSEARRERKRGVST